MGLNRPITPVIYGIGENVPSEIIKSQWSDYIGIIYNKEKDSIYDKAFRAIALAKEEKQNKYDGFGFFKHLLLLGSINVSEPHEELILRGVFDCYWNIAKNDKFWKNKTISYKNHIDYDEFIECWKKEYAKLIKERSEELESWLNT